jgi:O-antigen ligase
MFQVIDYAALFFVITNNLNHRNSAEIVTTTLIILGMALSLFAIYQFTTHSPRVSLYPWAKPAQYLNRGSGTFINPDNFAGFLEILIPLGLAYVLLSRMSATAKVLLAYATVMMMAGLCVSVSRGAMVATVVALALLCVTLLFEGGYVLPSLLALVLICGAAIGVRENFETAARRFDREVQPGASLSLGDRQVYWSVAGKIFEEHKLWGAGPAHFDLQFFMHRPERLQSRIIYAHNDYLNTLADWGGVGLAIILAFVGSLYYGAWRTWRSIRRKVSDIGLRQTDKGAFVIGGAFGLAAALFHCLVDFDMHVPADALLAVAIMALLAAHGRFVTERYWKNPGNMGKTFLALAGVAAMVCLVAIGLKQDKEQRWVERANAAERILEEPLDPNAPDPDVAAAAPPRQAALKAKIDALKNAYEIDPSDADVCFNLGETYWDLGSEGARGYQRKTLEAMQWYSRAILANPLNAYNYLQYGICLDWLDRHHEADFYFQRARDFDPNGWYVALWQGKHLVELGELAKAREWFYLAYVRDGGALLPLEYLRMVDSRLAEDAHK